MNAIIIFFKKVESLPVSSSNNKKKTEHDTFFISFVDGLKIHGSEGIVAVSPAAKY